MALPLGRVRIVARCDCALIADLPLPTVNAQFSTPVPMQNLSATLDRFRLRCGRCTRTLASRFGNRPRPVFALHYVTRVGLTRHSIPFLLDLLDRNSSGLACFPELRS